jgi:hypothetical protein
MEMPMLEKFILAKMPLPNEVQMLIKKYLQVPTPTARLMKQVSFDYTQYINRTCIRGTGVRFYELRGRWSAPPLRPEIQYLHTYRDVHTRVLRSWNNITGELIHVGEVRRALITWPVLDEPESLPTWSWYTREAADEMALRVRNWTPVGI